MVKDYTIYGNIYEYGARKGNWINWYKNTGFYKMKILFVTS